MPRRTYARRRNHRVDLPPAKPQLTPDQLAQGLVGRGLVSAFVLDEHRLSPDSAGEGDENGGAAGNTAGPSPRPPAGSRHDG